jgi:hypothetical protein
LKILGITAIPDKSKSGGIYVQVKRGNGSNFQVLPGPGLARLKVANPIYVQRDYPTWVNTDLAFLSSLTCATVYEAPATLMSLAGLDNVVDGVRVDGGNAVFYFRESPNLTNVSALKAYGRCGTSTQRPDVFPATIPIIKVQGCTDVLQTWATLCNYSLYGVCPGTPNPPRSGGPPPIPPMVS